MLMKPFPANLIRWVVVVVILLATPAPTGKDDATAVAMRRKLKHAEKILPGLASHDFPMLETNAGKLVELSRGGGWLARQTPEYALFLTEFQRAASELAKAAAAKDIDGATAAYNAMTTSCVACHKYIRGDAAKN
jgi:hypothetical protein